MLWMPVHLFSSVLHNYNVRYNSELSVPHISAAFQIRRGHWRLDQQFQKALRICLQKMFNLVDYIEFSCLWTSWLVD